MEPAPNLQQKVKGGSFKFVMPAPKHEGKWLKWPRYNKTYTKYR